MAYIGAEPVPGQNREVDDISSGFNGNATAFTLQVSSVNVSPESANNILINLGGVLQNPGTDYTIAASTITFTTAPASGLSFFGLILGAGINTATVADQTIGTSKVLDNAITADKLAHTSVTAGSYTTADITVDAQGRITAAANGTIATAEIADQAVTNAKVNNSAAIDVSKLSGVMPLAGGTFTGDVAFDGATAGRDIIFDRSADTLTFADSAVASFGASGDLRIFHNGSDSVLQEQGTGSLKILSNQTQIINAANSENIANFNQDGTVELFHNNSRKFQTLSTGINVYGSGSTFLELGSEAGGTDSVFIDTSHASNTKPNMDFKLDGDLAMRIDSSSNLDISSGILKFSKSVYGEQDSENFYRIKFNDTGGVANDVGIGQPDSASLGFNTVSNGTIRFYNGTDGESMRIDDAGRLLIGFTSDLSGNDTSAKLQVTHTGGGTIRLVRDDLTVTQNENLGRLIFSGRDGGANVECAEIRATATQTHGTSARGTKLTFHLCGSNSNSPTQQMSLSEGGKLGIGPGNNAARMLGVSVPSTQGNIGAAEFANNKASNSATVVFISTLRDGSSSENFLQCNRDQDNNGQGVAAVFHIRTNGDCDSLTGSYGSISDVRLKENIVDAKSQWDDIKNLRIRNFNFKEDPSQKMLGLVAQEVETICPNLVKEVRDQNLTSSSSGDEETTTKSIKTSILYMKAIKALQEAIAKIETLETKVAALEAA